MSSPEAPTEGAAREFPRRFDTPDRVPYRMRGFRDMWKVVRSGGFGDAKGAKALAHQVPRAPQVPAKLPAAPANEVRVTWAGHSSFVLQTAGRTLLLDPVWSPKLPGNTPRITPVGLPWEALPPVDALLVSHNHYDHLDKPTVTRLPRDTPCFVPANLGPWFRKLGFTRVTEMDWWETAALGDLEVSFVPAQHWSRRTPFDTNKTLWGGFVVTPPGGAGRTYFAGDSGHNATWFKQIGERFPGIDLALIPIGAYEPRWFMEPVHMNPEEALQVFRDVRAKRFVPMHWGTFSLTREPLPEPPERLRAAWAQAGLPRENLWDLALGETRTLRIP
ncbi:MAG TPA: MBL fold metallo-hydrolase [Candidatus Thermoplasmatota archaeon]|nr:MBL fold metallo-hydrolase [Candidatus Thermoplasmatota archaeon]